MKRGVVLPHLLARDAVAPGNVVINTRYPNQNKYKSESLKVSIFDGSLQVTKVEDFKDLQKRDQGTGLSVLLSRLLKLKLDAQAQHELSIDTKKVITYELDNHDETFAALCQEPDFQHWLEKAVKLRDVYFAVGLQTIADAVLDLEDENSAEASAGADPTAKQLGGEVYAEVSAHKHKGRGVHFKAVGEQTYAILYRKIAFKLLAAKEVATASLDRRQFWKTYLRTRGTANVDTYTAVELVDLVGIEDEEFEVVSSDANLELIAHSNSDEVVQDG